MHQRRHHHAEHSAGQQAGGQQQRQRALAALPQHQPHQPGPEQPEQQALHQRIAADATAGPTAHAPAPCCRESAAPTGLRRDSAD
ncbi:hypothetical protein G6F35_017537 [Rhizopus arrhizus]|nr:hypothetical protein G6F35_017537 [Rhizopus arrhizus]